ncbi:MAG: hypothetical protein IGS38_06165 [Synechococcales cyanobacterium M58_A2018_015]|nr:hypothetical protein [Synechococcales cyanobacterium M58_A2018_015]
MQRRCDRNRKRSKRRAIYCPIHGCYLDSVSQKHRLYTDNAKDLQQRGMGRQRALLLLASHTAVSLESEWLEAFWCEDCQQRRWYHVRKLGDRQYSVEPAPVDLWQQAEGMIHPDGNPSVGEFTRRQARRVGYHGIKDFAAIH